MLTLELLNSLSTSNNDSEWIDTQKLFDIPNHQVIGFVDNRGLYHICLTTKENKRFSSENRGGLSVSKIEIIEKTMGKIFILDFKCNSPEFLKYFIQILNEIFQYDTNEMSIESITKMVIRKWYQFINNPRPNLLSRSEIIGLFGELLVLKKMLEISEKPYLTIESWVGPNKDEKDFVFPGSEIEVKSTASNTGHIHEIHGETQLGVKSCPLFLASVLLKETSSGDTMTLNGLVLMLSSLLSDDEIRYTFFNKLLDVGYNVIDSEGYDEFEFRLEEMLFYPVSKSFPKIVKGESLDIDWQRVKSLKYKIDINGLPTVDASEILQNDVF